MVLIIIGICTTWSILSSTILCLINHPEYQDKIFAELAKNISQNRRPNYMDKANCPMLVAVEMEVHRLVPIIPVSLGHVCTKDVKMEGYDIPEGTEVNKMDVSFFLENIFLFVVLVSLVTITTIIYNKEWWNPLTSYIILVKI